jgi:phosphate transport system protein
MIKDKYLELISDDFKQLSELALRQIYIAKQVLENKDNNLFVQVEENEKAMDRLDLTIRDKFVFAVLQFNPKGEALRFIITHYDIAKYLERVGDLLLNIVHFIEKSYLELSEFHKIKLQLATMLSDTETMLEIAIVSYFNRDSAAAYNIIEMDDLIDNHFWNIEQMLQLTFSDKLMNQKEMINILNISHIAQNLERVGDNATNIAESTIFLEEGTDIRHVQLKN